ncbi:MAG: glutamate synthase-related protein [Pseudomonadota bacterium]
MKKLAIARLKDLKDRQPAHALVANVDLVVTRFDNDVSVLYGRCLHRGALMSDGFVDKNDNLICGVHNWDYRIDTGVSEYDNAEVLHKFTSWIKGGQVFVDEEEIAEWAVANPQPYDREAYLGQYQDSSHGTAEEPFNATIQKMARGGIEAIGHHGPIDAMGVPRTELPTWDDIQILTAQLHKLPLLDEEPVDTRTVIGPRARKPLELDIPLFVSDMSFGALSEPAKLALARGAELAGTGICSGEGGMLSDEQAANSRYFYELASARFGFSWDKVERCQAFHFKGGQGAKTGTGGHLTGEKVVGKIAKTRGLSEGTPAISPSRFPEWTDLSQFRDFAEEVRARTGGIPVGYKLSAQHIEKDIDAALSIGVDYIILDGRGGGTGAAPLIFRDNISIPTIPALAVARAHLDRQGADHVSLVITGGLRKPEDYVKALALGADAIALSNAAMQAIGCIAMRACHTDNCPVGIASQKPHLVSRLVVEKSAQRLKNYFESATELMKVLARACGHHSFTGFTKDDLATFDPAMAEMTGIYFPKVGGRG